MDSGPPAKPLPCPRVVLSANVVARGVLIVIGESLPITHGAGLCILIQQDCDIIMANGRVD